MKNEKIELYKNKLEQEKALIEVEIKKGNIAPDFGTETNDIEDKAPEVEAFGDQMAIAIDLKKRLAEIETALGKIAAGKYGICEKCGNDIEESILDIDPESSLCKNCKLAI